MPDRGALRIGGRRCVHLAENDEGAAAAVERRLAVPRRPRRARELRRVELDGRVGVDGIDVQVVKARRCQHGSPLWAHSVRPSTLLGATLWTNGETATIAE